MSICLSMIVRDESHVIRRCLESVKPFINSFCIVDTGSTDDTRDIVREVMKDKPGMLHNLPWVNFGHNRTEAVRMAEAMADYLFTIDADEVLVAPDGFQWPVLTADGYYLPVNYAGTAYARLALIATKLHWKWVGVLHESLESSTPAAFETLTEPSIQVYHEGARSRDPFTYQKDAEVLDKALAADPTNARYAFYLAQSWKDAGKPERALAAYYARIAIPGWVEETWFAYYQVGVMKERLECSAEDVQAAYLNAYQYRPTRAEPLYQLSRYHNQRREFALAALFAREGLRIPYPTDKLFVEQAVYRWQLLDQLGIADYYLGATAEGVSAIARLLQGSDLPESERQRVEMNLAFYGEHR